MASVGASAGISPFGHARTPLGDISIATAVDSIGGHGSLPEPQGAGHSAGQLHGAPSCGCCSLPVGMDVCGIVSEWPAQHE